MNRVLFYLQLLVSYYDEMIEEGVFTSPFTFDEFVRNEWEKREELCEWNEENPDKNTYSYMCGVLLREIE